MGFLVYILSILLSFLLLVFILFATSLLAKPLLIRVNKYIVIGRFSNYISQSLSFKQLIHLQFKNNFKSRELNTDIINSQEDMEKFFLCTAKKECKTTTNTVMYNLLKKIEKKGIIKIYTIKDKGKKCQIIPKLFLHGFKTFIMNIFNIEYWKFLFRKEEIKTYKIEVIRRTVSDVNCC